MLTARLKRELKGRRIYCTVKDWSSSSLRDDPLRHISGQVGNICGGDIRDNPFQGFIVDFGLGDDPGYARDLEIVAGELATQCHSFKCRNQHGFH